MNLLQQQRGTHWPGSPWLPYHNPDTHTFPGTQLDSRLGLADPNSFYADSSTSSREPELFTSPLGAGMPGSQTFGGPHCRITLAFCH